MEFLGILFLIVIILGAFKLLGIIFKAGIFLISIPFQIIGAVLLAIFVAVMIPAGIVAGIIALILAPLLIFGPLLPIILLVIVIYFIVK